MMRRVDRYSRGGLLVPGAKALAAAGAVYRDFLRRESAGDLRGLYAIRNSFPCGGNFTHASEQQILSCSGAGTCNGGFYGLAFEYVRAKSLTTDDVYPYTAMDSTCPDQTKLVPALFQAAGGYYWVVERPPGGFASNGIASPEIIKEALCQHGPLA